jgi:hypothetical protein
VLEEVVEQVPSEGTGPDALEEILGNIPDAPTGPDALSQVGPALSEPIKELQDESKRSDRDAVPEAVAAVASLITSAKGIVPAQPPTAPASPDTPAPVEVPTPVQVSAEEAPPKNDVPERHEPLNLRFGPESRPDPSSFAISNPMNVGTKSLDKAVELRNRETRKEEELINAAALTEAPNFGQSNTPIDKQGENVRATRRAKAAAIRNARDVADALRGKITPLSGGRNRRKGNRWTHRRKR